MHTRRTSSSINFMKGPTPEGIQLHVVTALWPWEMDSCTRVVARWKLWLNKELLAQHRFGASNILQGTHCCLRQDARSVTRKWRQVTNIPNDWCDYIQF